MTSEAREQFLTKKFGLGVNEIQRHWGSNFKFHVTKENIMQNDAVDVSLKKKLILRSPEVTQSQKCSKRGQKKIKILIIPEITQIMGQIDTLGISLKK